MYINYFYEICDIVYNHCVTISQIFTHVKINRNSFSFKISFPRKTNLKISLDILEFS